MERFEISKKTLEHLSVVATQVEKVQSSPLRDYCKCTGFGG